MIERAMRAARLDAALYETVEHDRSYTQEALLIVVIVAILGGIGSWLGPGPESIIGLLISAIISGILGWLIWAGVTLFVGTAIFKGTADYGEMLRVLGFAEAPLALGVIPVIGGIVGGIWAVVAGVVAVRQGLDLTTGQAAATVVIGFIGLILAFILVGLLLGGSGTALFGGG